MLLKNEYFLRKKILLKIENLQVTFYQISTPTRGLVIRTEQTAGDMR